MLVYVETIILDNFLIDALLLLLTNRFTRCPVSAIGIILAASFGTGFALFSPFLTLTGVWLWLAKLLVAVIMVLLSLPSLYRLGARLITFLLLTFLFGGALMAIFYFLGTPIASATSFAGASAIPIGGMLAVVLALALLLGSTIRRFYSIRRVQQYLVDVTICIRDNPISMRGFVDTGNGLIDNHGKPVVILNERDLRYWFNPTERVDLLLHRFRNVRIHNPHTIRLNSVSSGQSIVVFDADYILLGNRKLPIAVGVHNHNGSLSRSFDVLLNYKLLEVA
ncbi:MAG: sigma-E processing peptidase SpoIIGA [Clostridia bacterium]|nr:sigma-E processing peptidase SpoIIGA [Clostridia bacterium]